MKAKLDNDKSKTVEQRKKEMIEYRNKFLNKYLNIKFLNEFEKKYINPILQNDQNFDPKKGVNAEIFGINNYVEKEIKKRNEYIKEYNKLIQQKYRFIK